MTQKGKEEKSKNAIGRMLALRWEPIHITKHSSRDILLHKLPLAQGYDLILVVVNRLTKIVHFILTTEKMKAEGLARLFKDNV